MSLRLRFREQLQCRDAAAAPAMEMSALEIARKYLKKAGNGAGSPKTGVGNGQGRADAAYVDRVGISNVVQRQSRCGSMPCNAQAVSDAGLDHMPGQRRCHNFR